MQSFRILIRASNWLGDSVISVPAVRAIKSARPDAHITVAAPKKIAALWKLVPEVDEIVPISHRSLFSTVRSIRRQPRFDVTLLFPNSLRVALESWLGGAPQRIGYCGHSRRWLLDKIVPEPTQVGPPQHQAFHYLRLAHALEADGKQLLPAQLPRLSASRPAPPQSANIKPQRTLLGLCPGAEYGPAKRWLPERFAEAAKIIGEQHDVHWILFGTEKDGAMGREIAETLGESCFNRIGQTSIEELIAELRTCRLLLTNDTGTMHLASLIGVPVAAIFGSTEPRLTGPLGEDQVILRHQVECSPCFLRKCPIDFRCMKAVTVAEVVETISAMLARTAAAAGSNAPR